MTRRNYNTRYTEAQILEVKRHLEVANRRKDGGRQPSLQGVENKRKQAERFAHHAKDIGCPDIAAANLAHP